MRIENTPRSGAQSRSLSIAEGRKHKNAAAAGEPKHVMSPDKNPAAPEVPLAAHVSVPLADVEKPGEHCRVQVGSLTGCK